MTGAPSAAKLPADAYFDAFRKHPGDWTEQDMQTMVKFADELHEAGDLIEMLIRESEGAPMWAQLLSQQLEWLGLMVRRQMDLEFRTLQLVGRTARNLATVNENVERAVADVKFYSGGAPVERELKDMQAEGRIMSRLDDIETTIRRIESAM
ncbi:MAG TPA: hypothetical protein PKW05_04365 [Anaerolineae bacterium]|nr:hypothetical protein [Anaerolineae bacterium]HQJ50994.1 hypothetical protein [Anaerolineae bacterium]